MVIDVEIQGLKEAQAEMEQIVRDLAGPPFLQAMRAATLLVQRSAKQFAPVDTGRLRASITPEVRARGAVFEGVVGSNVKYAPFQELGTRAHFVPAQYIGRWARRHGLPEGGLFVTGDSHPFLRPALVENREKILKLIGDAVGTIVTKG